MKKIKNIKLYGNVPKKDFRFNDRRSGLSGTIYFPHIQNAAGRYESIRQHMISVFPYAAKYFSTVPDTVVKPGENAINEYKVYPESYADPKYKKAMIDQDFNTFCRFFHIEDNQRREFFNAATRSEIAFQKSDYDAAEIILNQFAKASLTNEVMYNGLLNEHYENVDASNFNVAASSLASLLGKEDLYAPVQVTEVSINKQPSKCIFIGDVEGLDPAGNDMARFTEGEVPGRKLLTNSFAAKKQLIDMSVFDTLLGTYDNKADSYKMVLDENGAISKITRVNCDHGISFTIFPSKKNLISYLSLISEDMADRILKLDTAAYSDMLKSLGFPEAQREACINNIELAKEIVNEGIEYSRKNPGTDFDGTHVRILKDSDIELMSIDTFRNYCSRYPEKSSILKEIESKDFYMFGHTRAENNEIKMHTNTIDDEFAAYNEHVDYILNPAFVVLEEQIKSNVRKNLFGRAKENSPGYNAIITAMKELDKAKEGSLETMTDSLADLVDVCESYITSHRNPLSKEGKERLALATRMKEASVKAYEEAFLKIPANEYDSKRFAKILMLNDGYSLEAIADAEKNEKFYNRYYSDAVSILAESKRTKDKTVMYNCLRECSGALTAAYENYEFAVNDAINSKEFITKTRPVMKETLNFLKEFEQELDIHDVKAYEEQFDDTAENGFSVINYQENKKELAKLACAVLSENYSDFDLSPIYAKDTDSDEYADIPSMIHDVFYNRHTDSPSVEEAYNTLNAYAEGMEIDKDELKKALSKVILTEMVIEQTYIDKPDSDFLQLVLDNPQGTMECTRSIGYYQSFFDENDEMIPEKITEFFKTPNDEIMKKIIDSTDYIKVASSKENGYKTLFSIASEVQNYYDQKYREDAEAEAEEDINDLDKNEPEKEDEIEDKKEKIDFNTLNRQASEEEKGHSGKKEPGKVGPVITGEITKNSGEIKNIIH